MVIPTDESSDEDIISYWAYRYSVPESVLHKVISCESTYNPNAIGDGGKSVGWVQIHSDYHPEITDEERRSKMFSAEFLAKNVSQGKGRMWTCWRKYYG